MPDMIPAPTGVGQTSLAARHMNHSPQHTGGPGTKGQIRDRTL